MSLKKRRERFAQMTSRFNCDLPDPLLAIHRINAIKLQRLQAAALIYMSKCMNPPTFSTDEYFVMNHFKASRDSILNCTPNGMLVPKRHLILEYNMMIQAFVDIINDLNIGDFISSWHVPLNLRYKDAGIVPGNLERHHPTEHIHSDSWAGESSESVTTIIPLLGDAPGNRVDYFSPPEDFEESWLGPLPSYKDGAEIARKYKKLEVPFHVGNLYLADFAVLHSSSRYPKCSNRVSIDTTFAMSKSVNREEVIHKWREDERVNHEDLLSIGTKKIFVFPDTNNEQVDSQGGFKHPTNLIIRDIL